MISKLILFSRSRFLRNKDRDVHYHMYPKLFYPELYLIEGGYKAFFGKCKVRVLRRVFAVRLELCEVVYLSHLLDVAVCLGLTEMQQYTLHVPRSNVQLPSPPPSCLVGFFGSCRVNQLLSFTFSSWCSYCISYERIYMAIILR